MINTKSKHTSLNCQDYSRARVLFKDFSSHLFLLSGPAKIVSSFVSNLLIVLQTLPPFLGCWDTQQQSLLGVRQTSNLGLLAPVESIPFRVPRCIIFIFLTNLQICQFPSVNVLLQLLFHQIQSSARVRFEVIRPLGCSGV